jgi:hypothetical protein
MKRASVHIMALVAVCGIVAVLLLRPQAEARRDDPPPTDVAAGTGGSIRPYVQTVLRTEPPAALPETVRTPYPLFASSEVHLIALGEVSRQVAEREELADGCWVPLDRDLDRFDAASGYVAVMYHTMAARGDGECPNGTRIMIPEDQYRKMPKLYAEWQAEKDAREKARDRFRKAIADHDAH